MTPWLKNQWGEKENLSAIPPTLISITIIKTMSLKRERERERKKEKDVCERRFKTITSIFMK